MPKLNYNAIRENDLNDKEFRLLTIVSSYSKSCHLKCSDFMRMMNVSDKTVRRTIKSLQKKGHIEVKYWLYKTMIITISYRSPMTYTYRSNEPVISVTGVHHIGHPRPNQYRVNKEVTQSSGMLPSKFQYEEPNPEDFTLKFEDILEMKKRGGLKVK